jgi:protein SCO1/2
VLGLTKALIVLCVVLGITTYVLPLRAQDQRERTATELMEAVMWGKEPIGGPFALTDHTGRRRTDADFRGKFLLIYFGFSFCPDVCPTDLMAMGLALDKMGPAGDVVQPVFITVDPERDTPEHLAHYVPFFHPRMVGLTGDAAEIRGAASAYKVYYAKAAIAGGSSYTVDHSGFIYLMDRDGQYLGFFPPGTSAEQMVAVIKPLVGVEPPH